MTGSASVIRNDKTTPLKVKDDIYLNDVVQTAANSALGITFIDATTFNLKASTKITIDNYVYEDGGKSNAAIFDVAKGTAAFVAASVAKTGDMKIIDADGNARHSRHHRPRRSAGGRRRQQSEQRRGQALSGRRRARRPHRGQRPRRRAARLFTQGASGFTIRPGAGGARFAAVPLAIPQAVMLRDQGFVRQLHSTQNFGRQLVFQQREFRRANPGFVNPNRPIRQFQPGQQRPNGLPGAAPPACLPASGGRMVCRDNPVSRHCRAYRTARDSSSPVSSIVPDSSNSRATEPARSQQHRARRRARDNDKPARPINPACRRGPDNRRDPVCRHSPDCRHAQANRNGPICRGSPPRRWHGRDCRTGSAVPDCSACPAFRVRRPATAGTARRAEAAAPAPQRGKPPRRNSGS